MKRCCLLQRVLRITTSVFVSVMLLACATVVNASEEKQDEKWHFVITPYIWIPSISGSMKLETPPGFGNGNLDYGSGSYLEYLDFVAMLDLQVQKGKWSLLMDILYVDFSGNQTADFPGVLPWNGGWTTAADWDLRALVFRILPFLAALIILTIIIHFFPKMPW